MNYVFGRNKFVTNKSMSCDICYDGMRLPYSFQCGHILCVYRAQNDICTVT